MTTATPVINFPKSFGAAPTFFDGSEDHYPTWKRQVQLYVLSNDTHFVDDTARQMTALTYMREKKALRWAISISDQIIAGALAVRVAIGTTPAVPNPYTRTWAEFWAAADAVFSPPNVQADAAYKLENLVQGKMAAEGYFTEFDLLAGIADLSQTHFDAHKIRMANRQLNRALVDRIHNITTLPTTWVDYKARAIVLDNNWRIGQQSRSDPRSSVARPQPQQQYWKTQAHPNAPSSQSRLPVRDPDAMDTSVVRVAASATQQAPQRPNYGYTGNNFSSSTPRPRVEGDRDALMKAGACFYCKEPGHMKRSCPTLAAKAVQGTYTPAVRPPNSSVRSTNVDIPESPAPSYVSPSVPTSYASSVASSQVFDDQSDFASGRE
jgi:hypothetical protein